MKHLTKLWPIFAVAIGGFLVWEYFLSQQNSALYAQNKDDKDAKNRGAAANNAAQALTPPLAVVDTAKAIFETLNLSPSTNNDDSSYTRDVNAPDINGAGVINPLIWTN